MLVNKVPQCSSMESKNVFSSPFTVFWLQPCTMGWFHRECSENIFWTQTDRVWPKVIRLWLILGFRAFRRPNGQIRALQVIRSFSTEIVVRSDICQIGWKIENRENFAYKKVRGDTELSEHVLETSMLVKDAILRYELRRFAKNICGGNMFITRWLVLFILYK